MRKHLTLAFGLTLLLAACGSETGEAGQPGPGPGPEPVEGFALTVSPTALTVNAGDSESARVTIRRSSSFKGEVKLSATNLPAGVEASFDPEVIPAGSVSSTVTFDADADAKGASATVTIGGESGQYTDSASLKLTVVAAPGPGPEPEPTGPVKLTSPDAAVVLVQNGGSSWKELKGTDGVYKFEVTGAGGRYGVAIGCFDDNAYLIQATVADATEFTLPCDRSLAIDRGKVNVQGAVLGADGIEGEIYIADRSGRLLCAPFVFCFGVRIDDVPIKDWDVVAIDTESLLGERKGKIMRGADVGDDGYAYLDFGILNVVFFSDLNNAIPMTPFKFDYSGGSDGSVVFMTRNGTLAPEGCGEPTCTWYAFQEPPVSTMTMPEEPAEGLTMDLIYAMATDQVRDGDQYLFTAADKERFALQIKSADPAKAADVKLDLPKAFTAQVNTGTYPTYSGLKSSDEGLQGFIIQQSQVIGGGGLLPFLGGESQEQYATIVVSKAWLGDGTSYQIPNFSDVAAWSPDWNFSMQGSTTWVAGTVVSNQKLGPLFNAGALPDFLRFLTVKDTDTTTRLANLEDPDLVVKGSFDGNVTIPGLDSCTNERPANHPGNYPEGCP
jgi:hypothetical protein